MHNLILLWSNTIFLQGKKPFICIHGDLHVCLLINMTFELCDGEPKENYELYKRKSS